jgi:hypothetical protein
VVSFDEGADQLAIEFRVERTPLVDNATDFRSAKRTLNDRARDVMREFQQMRLSHGTSDPYNFTVRMPRRERLGQIREFVLRMITQMERG